MAKIEEDISEKLHMVLGKDLWICCRLRVAELNMRRWVWCYSGMEGFHIGRGSQWCIVLREAEGCEEMAQ